jgi:hypothetical protein
MLTKIRLICPRCKTFLRASSARAGQRGRCPKCRKLIDITAPPEAKPAVYRQCGGCKRDLWVSTDLLGKRVKCPTCRARNKVREGPIAPPIPFTCSHCLSNYRISAEKGGTSGTCHVCDMPIVVPPPEKAVAPPITLHPPGSPVTSPPPAVDQFAGLEPYRPPKQKWIRAPSPSGTQVGERRAGVGATRPGSRRVRQATFGQGKVRDEGGHDKVPQGPRMGGSRLSPSPADESDHLVTDMGRGVQVCRRRRGLPVGR